MSRRQRKMEDVAQKVEDALHQVLGGFDEREIHKRVRQQVEHLISRMTEKALLEVSGISTNFGSVSVAWDSPFRDAIKDLSKEYANHWIQKQRESIQSDDIPMVYVPCEDLGRRFMDSFLDEVYEQTSEEAKTLAQKLVREAFEDGELSTERIAQIREKVQGRVRYLDEIMNMIQEAP